MIMFGRLGMFDPSVSVFFYRPETEASAALACLAWLTLKPKK
jgi:hypothetical protein